MHDHYRKVLSGQKNKEDLTIMNQFEKKKTISVYHWLYKKLKILQKYFVFAQQSAMCIEVPLTHDLFEWDENGKINYNI